MATLAPDVALPPRASAETDRRHLLSDSVAPSEAASIVDFEDGDRTPRARSPARTKDDDRSAWKISAAHMYGGRRETIADPTPIARPYRGFPSEAHYLAALSAWAESKKYLETDNTLIGFYGQKTMTEYANQPRPEVGLMKKWKARKEAKQEAKTARRSTVV